jgi:hypothetical protein
VPLVVLDGVVSPADDRVPEEHPATANATANIPPNIET